MFDFIKKSVNKIFGTKSDKDIKAMMPYVDKVNEEYPKLKNISIDELRHKTVDFRARINDYLNDFNTQIDTLKAEADTNGVSVDKKEEIYEQVDVLVKDRDKALEVVLLEILPEAFAVVRETARRFTENDSVTATATELDRELAVDREHMNIEGDQVTYQTSWDAAGTPVEWNMIHYDVQLIGGLSLHQGKISEMQTGEGKTLVATLPAYLNALPGFGVHIVTVNDYLAKRDSEWMAPIFQFLGITIDCIDKYQPNSPERKKAYQQDITYGTNNEFGFDYLRDNMARSAGDIVQQKLHYAMIDEVDSVLIDDARTPLIISGPIPKGDEHEFYELKPRIEKLVSKQKSLASTLLIDAKKEIAAGKTNEKEGGLKLLRAYRGYPKNKALIKYLSEPGIKQILQKVENFYLQDQAKEMPFVDEIMYFTIEEKNNNIDLTDKGIDLITGEGEDPNLFIMPDVGGEIAEIEKLEISEEERAQLKQTLLQDFAIKSERIHSTNQLLKAYALFEKDTEYVVMDDKVKIVDEQTGRIMEGRRYSDGLHQAIEAKENVKVESATQTHATVTLQNFFRMYHKLAGMTGTAETEAGEFWEIYELDVVVIPTNRPIARDDREDKVYKTVREKYNAVIDEVVELSNAGRPVLVGTTSVEISELLSKMLKMRGINHQVLNAKQHSREADVVASAGIGGAVTIATNMAGRGTDIKINDEVKSKGGLAIVGTERHESRRVDRQLRGRAGRQGDPGSSQFFVSLEDNLMRLFGSERIAKLMDRMGYEEGEVIQHSMISNSLERAQKKVEENNFGIRKRLLEYDDVMNSQREVIYKRRRNALFGERLSVDINNMLYDLCEELVQTHKDQDTYEDFKLDVIRFLAVNVTIEEQTFRSEAEDSLTEGLYQKVMSSYETKSNTIGLKALPIIKRVFEDENSQFENIVVPFTDGVSRMQVVTNIEKAYNSEGASIMKDFEKSLVLRTIDQSWKEHLREMDDLKQSVQSAVYEQKDPLLIYKFESFELFKKMLSSLNKDIIPTLTKATIPIQENDEVQEAKQPLKQQNNLKAGRGGNQTQNQSQQPQANQAPKKQEPVKVGVKVGRNEACPCGSGKKFKNCHGKQ